MDEIEAHGDDNESLAFMELERMRVLHNDAARRLRELEGEPVADDAELAAAQIVEADRLRRVIDILDQGIRARAAALGIGIRDGAPAGPGPGVH